MSLSRFNLPKVLATALLVASTSHAGIAGADNDDTPWSRFPWQTLFTTPDQQVFALAEGSINRLAHAPSKRAFYLKVDFPQMQEAADRPFNREISDMFIDCERGQIDVLSAYRYLNDIAVDQKIYRNEQAHYIEPNTPQAQLFTTICPEPEFIKAVVEKSQRIKVRGSNPWK